MEERIELEEELRLVRELLARHPVTIGTERRLELEGRHEELLEELGG